MRDQTPCSWALSLFKHTPFLLIIISLLLVSTQTSAQWVKVNSLNISDVNNIAADPNNPSHILVGTDHIQNNISASGLYQTINSGITWSQVTSASMTGQPVRSISFAPSTDSTTTNSKVFVAIANQGVFKSLDGGISWTTAHVQNPQFPGAFLTQNVTQVIVTQANNLAQQKVYAVIGDDEQNAIGSAGIYSSLNDGVTWQKVSTGLTQKVRKLVVPLSQPDTLYVVTDTNELLKSINGGSSFSAAGSGLPIGAGASITEVIVDPNNPNSLYASAFRNNVQGFYRSINGGASWDQLNSLYIFHKLALSNSTNGLTPVLYGIAHEVANSVTTYAVYTSTDGGSSWANLDTSTNPQLFDQTLSALAVVNDKIYTASKDGLYSFPISAGGVIGVGNGLTINASTTATSIAPGQTIPINVVLQNTSGNIVSSVVLRSGTMPAGTRLAITGNDPSCNYLTSSNVIECNIANLQIDETKNVALSVILPATMPTNTTLSINFDAQATTTISASTSLLLGSGGNNGVGNGLTLNVSTTAAQLIPGQALPINISLQNTSGSLISTINLATNELPVGTALSSVGNSQACVYTASTRKISCTISNLQVNETRSIPLSVTFPTNMTATSLSINFDAQAPGTNVNAVNSLFLSTAGNNGNGLVISYNPTPTTFTPGQLLTFNVTLQNTGGLISTLALNTSLLPSGTTFSTSSSDSNCSYSTFSREVSCSISNLQANETRNIPLAVTLPANMTGNSLTINFNATATGVSATSSLTLASTVTSGTGVSLTTTSNATTISPGQALNLNVSMQNTSGVLLNSITLESNQFPSGTTFSTAVSDNSCIYSTSNRVVTCTITNLSANQTRNIPISVTLPTTLSGNSLALSFAATGAGVSATSNTSFSITSGNGGGMVVTATATPTQIAPGQTVTFNVAVQNNTGTNLGNVRVASNRFPVNSILSTATSSPGCSMSLSSSVVTCNIQSLTSTGENLSIAVTIPTATTQSSLAVSFTASALGVTAATGNVNVTLSSGGGVTATKPTANSVQRTTSAGQPVTFQLSGTKLALTDTLTYQIMSNGTKGTLSFSNGLTESTDPTVTYTPNADASGPDIMSYVVRDQLNRQSDTSAVTVTINAAPVDQQSSGGGSSSGGAAHPLSVLAIFGLMLFLRRKLA